MSPPSGGETERIAAAGRQFLLLALGVVDFDRLYADRMTEAMPLGLFADLLKWKLVSRLVVFLVTIAALIPPCIAIWLAFYFLFPADLDTKTDAEVENHLQDLIRLGVPAWLLLPLIGPPLMGCLYVQWAMFVRRARGQ